MGDFVEQTALTPISAGRFRATLSSDWKLWGPSGGYVSAIALRAVGETTDFTRPVSFACQFLRFARFEDVEIEVESLRRGRRTEALRVTLRQDGQPVLTAGVWAAHENEAMVHDYTRPPPAPAPETLAAYEERRPDEPRHPFFENFERRPIGEADERIGRPREPEIQGWYRFRPRARADDDFVDAARALILIDTFTWPATWPAHPSREPSPWIAPNLDLYVRFHRPTRPHAWLHGVSRAELAHAGLISADGALWSGAGELLATGHTQLFCSPRPARHR